MLMVHSRRHGRWDRLVLLGCISIAMVGGCDRPGAKTAGAPGGITYHQNIAPIMAQHCATCHHPGDAAPFDLITYADVSKRARDIAKVTRSRFMPPWLPEPGYGHFANERRLSDVEIATIGQWVENGAPEGQPAATPATQQWKEGWRLGEPDLVVQMPQTYTLPADGKDIYRNFVIPLPLETSRWVKAVELRPGNKRIVHHGFIMFDTSGSARKRDGQDVEVGYEGMDPGEDVRAPSGQFLSWQPGAMPSMGQAWRLPKGSDMVLQLHMRPSGKAEPIQSSLAIYFTNQPPTRTPFSFILRSTTIDIPAGEKNYIVESSYTLPVDVEVTAILPHAHYLGKRLEAWATLPDGKREPLILIKEWDFNWQGDYQYATPVALPKGTKLAMRYSFDNSQDNPRNPNHPPQRVKYGLQSRDEMAELGLQMLTLNAQDFGDFDQGQHDQLCDSRQHHPQPQCAEECSGRCDDAGQIGDGAGQVGGG